MHGRLSPSIAHEIARDYVEPAPSLRNQSVTWVTLCVAAVGENRKSPAKNRFIGAHIRRCSKRILRFARHHPKRRNDAARISRCAEYHAVVGGVNDDVRVIPAARPFPAITNAILRDASSIISSPSITAP